MHFIEFYVYTPVLAGIPYFLDIAIILKYYF